MRAPDGPRRRRHYYNHNIDTSERYYGEVIGTRCFADRLDTLTHVREAGIKVCCGGIVGMGEAALDRIDMLVTLANLPEPPEPPESVPINMLIPIPGTPLADADPIDPIEFIRTIALARIMMPRSYAHLADAQRRSCRHLGHDRRARRRAWEARPMSLRIVVTGTDTGIGKTVFATGLTAMLDGCYWKPVQAGLDEKTDSETVARLSGLPSHLCRRPGACGHQPRHISQPRWTALRSSPIRWSRQPPRVRS